MNAHSGKLSWRDQWVHWNGKGVENLDKLISKTRGQFCIGDELTLADILLYCQIDSAITRF